MSESRSKKDAGKGAAGGGGEPAGADRDGVAADGRQARLRSLAAVDEVLREPAVSELLAR